MHKLGLSSTWVLIRGAGWFLGVQKPACRRIFTRHAAARGRTFFSMATGLLIDQAQRAVFHFDGSEAWLLFLQLLANEVACAPRQVPVKTGSCDGRGSDTDLHQCKSWKRLPRQRLPSTNRMELLYSAPQVAHTKAYTRQEDGLRVRLRLDVKFDTQKVLYVPQRLDRKCCECAEPDGVHFSRAEGGEEQC